MTDDPTPDERSTGPTAPRQTSWGPWTLRWFSVGGAVTAVGLGFIVAALNWNAITRGLRDAAGTSDWAAALAATERYAIIGFVLLVIGQQMVTRRAIDQGR